MTKEETANQSVATSPSVAKRAYCCSATLQRVLCRYGPISIVLLSVGFYVTWGICCSFTRYYRFGAMAYDLGIFVQGIWLLSRFQTPFVTLRGLNLFADHFSPILLPLALLYRLFPDPRMLLVLQTLALGSGAIAVYLLALYRLRSQLLGIAIAWTYLLYPAVQRINLFDFHPDAFITPFFLFALVSLEKQNWRTFWLLLVCAFACKESCSLIGLLFGFYVGKRGGWKQGVAVSLVSFVWLLIALKTMQWLDGGHPSAYFWLYHAYGDSLYSIVTGVMLHPVRVISTCLSDQSLAYLGDLLYPLAFLPLLMPEILLVILPTLLSNLLADRVQMHYVGIHYSAPLIPYLLLATILGIERVGEILQSPPRWQKCVYGLLSAPLLLCAFIATRQMGGWFGRASPYPPMLSEVQGRLVRRWLQQIPPDASISAQSALTTWLAQRKKIYVFPNPFQEAAWGNSPQALRNEELQDFHPLPPQELQRRFAHSNVSYVVLNIAPNEWPLTADNYAYMVSQLLRSPAYGVVQASGDFLLLRRGADHERGLLRLHGTAWEGPLYSISSEALTKDICSKRPLLSRRGISGASRQSAGQSSDGGS